MYNQSFDFVFQNIQYNKTALNKYSSLLKTSTGAFPFTRPQNGQKCVYWRGAFLSNESVELFFFEIGPHSSISEAFYEKLL